MEIEYQVNPPPIRQYKPPMGWPEALTKIAYYAAFTIVVSGWPKIVKTVKVAKAEIIKKDAEPATDEKPEATTE